MLQNWVVTFWTPCTLNFPLHQKHTLIYYIILYYNTQCMIYLQRNTNIRDTHSSVKFRVVNVYFDVCV